MDISFDCKKCGQHIVIDEAGGGQTVQCPSCGLSLIVPRPATETLVSTPPPEPIPPVDYAKMCPYCAETIKAAARVCRFCGYDFVDGKRSEPATPQTIQQPVEAVHARSGVWDGVKIGCGMFIVLPLILLGIIALILYGCVEGCNEAIKSSVRKETTSSTTEPTKPSSTSSTGQTNETHLTGTDNGTRGSTYSAEPTNDTTKAASESSQITEAFGVTLGTKVNLSAYRKDGFDCYQFAPRNPLAGMSNYYFKATPRTGLIYRVGAEGLCESDQACNEKLKAFLLVLTRKYGAAKEESKDFVDALFGINSHKHIIRSGVRCVVAECSGSPSKTYGWFLKLYYNDDQLEKQADEEDTQARQERAEAQKEAERKRIELESKKIDGSGL